MAYNKIHNIQNKQTAIKTEHLVFPAVPKSIPHQHRLAHRVPCAFLCHHGFAHKAGKSVMQMLLRWHQMPLQAVFSCLVFTSLSQDVSAVGEVIESYGRTACYTTSSPMTRTSSSAWTTPTPRRLSTGSLTARPQFASGSCRTASNSTLTSQRWSFLAPLISSGQLPTSPPSTLLEALCRWHRSSSRLA